MNEFDQLLKEKAEEKKFKYSPLLWLFFAKKAGFATALYLKIAAIALSSIAVVSTGVYFGVQHFKTEPPVANPVTSLPEEEIVMQEDTVLIDTNAYNIDIKEDTITINPPQKTKPKVEDPITPPKEVTPIPKKDTVVAPKVVKKKPRYTIRPSEINPDTITSNY